MSMPDANKDDRGISKIKQNYPKIGIMEINN